MYLPIKPILEEEVKLGTTEDGVLCVRDEKKARLLKFGKRGECSARIVANTVPVREDAILQFKTKGTTIIYDDTKKVVRLSGESMEFYLSPDSQIIIRINPGKNGFTKRDIIIETINYFIHDCYYEREKKDNGLKIPPQGVIV